MRFLQSDLAFHMASDSTSGGTGDFEQDMLGREELLESSLPLVFETYDEAAKSRVAEPVVFLIDCEDPLGGQIARSWLGDDAVDSAIAMQSSEEGAAERTTVFARAFPFDQTRSEVARTFPYLNGSFAGAPPTDALIAVVVSYGGAATFFVPYDSRPD